MKVCDGLQQRWIVLQGYLSAREPHLKRRIAERENDDPLSQLAVRAKAGDQVAAGELALAVWPWVRKTAAEYAATFRVDSDDLESDGLSRLPYAIRGFDPAKYSNFLTYFARAATREMIERGRREARTRSHYQSQGTDETEAPSPVETAESRPELLHHESVWAAYRALNPQQRLIVKRVLGLGLDRSAHSFAAVARHLNMPENWVRNKFLRAIRKLRKVAADQSETGGHER